MSNNTQRNLKVVLLRHTPNPEEAIALGAKLCYSKAQIDDLLPWTDGLHDLCHV